VETCGRRGAGRPGEGLRGLGALGDPTRRAIFGLLAERSRSVGELAAGLPVSRPAVSQHLRTLRDAGLVTDRPAGTRRVYQVDPAGVAGLRACLDELWGDALAASARAVDGGTDPTKITSTAQT
jgi:DNA-binding transcriptional ArsR family regulator